MIKIIRHIPTEISHALIPTSNDLAALGSATKSWSDLFLASGGVINWANGNVTLTHATGSLTLAGNLLFTDNTYDIGATGATRPRNLFLAGDATIGDQLIVSGVGPHVIGGATSNANQLRITGTFTSGVADVAGVETAHTLVGGANSGSYFGVNIAPTFSKRSAGTHPDFVSLAVRPMTFGGGAATVTNASSLKITGAPTGATYNYALWVDAGLVRWDDPIALGGGAAPTLGTIGGSGPTTAAQNQWLRVNINGTDMFIPVWQ